jgi:phage pi2 protein 07
LMVIVSPSVSDSLVALADDENFSCRMSMQFQFPQLPYPEVEVGIQSWLTSMFLCRMESFYVALIIPFLVLQFDWIEMDLLKQIAFSIWNGHDRLWHMYNFKHWVPKYLPILSTPKVKYVLMVENRSYVGRTSRQEVGIISEDSQQTHSTHQNYHFDTTTMTASVPIATAAPI